MEEISGSSLSYIVELDKKARERVAQAKKQAEEINEEAARKKSRMLEDYNEHSQKRLKIVEESYGEQSDKRIAAIEDEKNKKMAAFEKAMADNAARLEKEIFEAVTGDKE